MIKDIAIESLLRADANVREDVDDEHLEFLARDIAANGLLHCPVVTPNDDDTYNVISGWRRVQACRLLKRTVVPCSVREDIEDSFLVSFSENMQRNPMTRKEICHAINRYMETNSAKDVARIMSLAPATVSRYNTIASLDDETLSRLDAKDDTRLTLAEAEKLAKGAPPLPMAENPTVVDEPPTKKAKAERKKPIKSEPWIYNHDNKPVAIPTNLYSKILDIIEPYIRQ